MSEENNEIDPKLVEYRQRYLNAAHAVQSGVAMDLSTGSAGADPKHLRVGIDTMKAEQGGLAGLLIEKGLITELEYYKAIAEGMEQEVARVQDELSKKFGTVVKLY